MIRHVLAAALLFSPVLASAQAPAVSLEHRMILRCSAAFAMISHGQDLGKAEALQYPRETEAYREFFVRASARVMDEAGLDRDGISAVLQEEAQKLWDEGTLDQVMPVCLDLLSRSAVPAG